MEDNNQQYIKGFNSGYLLSKYEPSLLDNILKQLSPSTEYLEGLWSGKAEHEREYTREQLDELSRLRDHSQERDKGLELP